MKHLESPSVILMEHDEGTGGELDDGNLVGDEDGLKVPQMTLKGRW